MMYKIESAKVLKEIMANYFLGMKSTEKKYACRYFFSWQR